jgi:hypothetical protein
MYHCSRETRRVVATVNTMRIGEGNVKNKLIPLDARCKALVCGRLPVGIVGSNPTVGMDVFLL